jgi:alanyl-tRNA synthetase
MNHNEVRKTFLDFFMSHDHKWVRSAPLIPHGDPTLMFTNAGMNQFKDTFTGLTDLPYKRATTAQKCLRVTGKHNDFEEVGRTARHHTFFEMLGNFSFGDYFKREAIAFAWELFSEKFKLNTDQMYVTVFLDDDEAHDIWEKEIGFPKERIYRLGERDNYWSMGPTGPNGPCSELHYDMEPPEGRLRTPEEISETGGDALVELWNLVFMQYNTDAKGVKSPLPKPSIDTGAGLERLTAVMQGVTSNYDTDLFMPYINAVADLAHVNYGDSKAAEANVSCRVIADHLRAMSFLIADGTLPSNEGRGYVLRRIIRRAIRHGRMIGLKDPFLHNLTGLVVDQMGTTYPELPENSSYLEKVVQSEELRFGKSFENSYKYFYNEGIEPGKEAGIVSGDVVFKAYDTYGMPFDLAHEIASEVGLEIDEVRFKELLEGQRTKARASWKGSGEEAADPIFHKILKQHGPTEFVGYKSEVIEEAKVLAIVKNGAQVERLDEGETALVVFDKTPFYAESGGQMGDSGLLTFKGLSAEITDTQKAAGSLHLHNITVTTGGFAVGGLPLNARVDGQRRAAIRANHTVTHIIHWALKDLLGDHVKQAGSLVDADRLRFDFTHFSAMDEHEMELLEKAVNQKIRDNTKVDTEEKSLDDALNAGVTALFGEKYGDSVRVVSAGDFSSELCGGTHVSQTGEIGLFHLSSESSVAAGVRRIEGVTGAAAEEVFHELHANARQIAGLFRSTPEGVIEAAQKLLEESKLNTREIEALKLKLASSGGSGGGDPYEVIEVGKFKIATQQTSGLDVSTLKNLADEVRSKIKSGAVLLGDGGEKATLVLACTDDVTDKINCGKLIKDIGKFIQGGGGGSPTMAQAGGKQADKIPEALQKGRDLLAEILR